MSNKMKQELINYLNQDTVHIREITLPEKPEEVQINFTKTTELTIEIDITDEEVWEGTEKAPEILGGQNDT